MHIRNWCKGEIMDMRALCECVLRKEALESMKLKAMSKLKDDRSTAEKMSAGKMTMKGLFKSKSGKEEAAQALLADISQGERDIINYDVIRTFLTIYMAEVAVPYWKDMKMKNYVRVMGEFASEEISNSVKHQECWNDFVNSIAKVKIKK